VSRVQGTQPFRFPFAAVEKKEGSAPIRGKSATVCTPHELFRRSRLTHSGEPLSGQRRGNLNIQHRIVKAGTFGFPGAKCGGHAV
jgi:hypothetical protein